MIPAYITLARPYATAIFNLAIKDNNIINWKQQLQICTKIASTELIQQQCLNGVNSIKLIEIFISIGKDQINQETKNLISIMTQNKRLNLFPNILNYFLKLIDDYYQIIHLEIISAYKLELIFLNSIHEKLKKYFSKKIIFKHTIDSSIIGGLVIKNNDQTIDYSISTQLKILSNIIKN
ncbi:ATP synthase subunit delta [Buchnera aphidicola (Eriosoma lanigerum)]|uniref:F0F1 ATP synthase subunit delta n=1 Tax=Buchnera aphidicola TaxID=9 RepID=UPI003464D92C